MKKEGKGHEDEKYIGRKVCQRGNPQMMRRAANRLSKLNDAVVTKVRAFEGGVWVVGLCEKGAFGR